MTFAFFDPGVLRDAELTLRLDEAVVDTSGWEPIPTYRFRMVNSESKRPMGGLNLRVGITENLTRYRGHIGFAVDISYRGRGYAGGRAYW
jgi:predicted acetyltransferase